jgi:hypothetical protein
MAMFTVFVTTVMLEFNGRPRITSAVVVPGVIQLRQEGAVFLERLIEERFDGYGSAVGSPKQASLFECVQVSANGYDRNSQFIAQIIHCN